MRKFDEKGLGQFDWIKEEGVLQVFPRSHQKEQQLKRRTEGVTVFHDQSTQT